jgi:hypothetical protein
MCLVPAVACAGIYPNYILYASLRFLSAVCLPIIWVNQSVYCYEIFSPKVSTKNDILDDIVSPGKSNDLGDINVFFSNLKCSSVKVK